MTAQDDSPPTAATPASPGQGTNQTGMRERNERLVLTLLRRSSGLAKADIARHTGLSAQTVSRMIRSLEQDHLIRHGEPQRGRVGQPSVPVSLNPSGAYFLGMKVGRRSVEVILTDFLGQIVDREKKIYDYPDFDKVLAFTLDRVAAIRARMDPAHRDRVAGLGVAMPYHLWSWASRIGVSPDAMEKWRSHDLHDALAAQLDIPVFPQNDATAACSAELVFGEGPVPQNFLGFYVAFFIGGGLVLRGSLFTGAAGNAAGLGPLLVPDLDGTPRPLIDLASLSTLEQGLIAAGQPGRHLWDRPEDWDIPRPLLEAWLDRAAPALAYAVRAVQTLLDLDGIMIDGWLPRELLSELVARVDGALDGIDLTGINRPPVVSGTIGADARTLGAASLPLSARFLTE